MTFTKDQAHQIHSLVDHLHTLSMMNVPFVNSTIGSLRLLTVPGTSDSVKSWHQEYYPQFSVEMIKEVLYIIDEGKWDSLKHTYYAEKNVRDIKDIVHWVENISEMDEPLEYVLGLLNREAVLAIHGVLYDPAEEEEDPYYEDD